MVPPLPLSDPARAAFLLGCQGPDPFFYSFFTHRPVERMRFGRQLHKTRVVQSLDVLRAAASVYLAERAQVLEGYLRGWLAHFTLDSSAHPYIIATERALTGAGVKGLGQEAHSEVHGQIESDLDGMMLARRYGVTIRTFRPLSEVLLASNEALELIGVMLRRVAAEAFALRLPDSAYKTAVLGMRFCYRVLYSPSGLKRDLLGRVERLFRPHSMAQATAHRADVGPECDFDNRQHNPWLNPFTGEKSEAGFLDIYSEAVALCVARQALLSAGAPSHALTDGLNFEGQPIE